jgi:hypothetical protein
MNTTATLDELADEVLDLLGQIDRYGELRRRIGAQHLDALEAGQSLSEKFASSAAVTPLVLLLEQAFQRRKLGRPQTDDERESDPTKTDGVTEP